MSSSDSDAEMPQQDDQNPRAAEYYGNRARVARKNLIASIDACFLAHSKGDERGLHWVSVNFPRLLDGFRQHHYMVINNNLTLLARCRDEPELRALFRNYVVNHYDLTLGTQFQPPPDPDNADQASLLAYINDLKGRIRKLTDRAWDWGQFAVIPATDSLSSTDLLHIDTNLPGPSALNAAVPGTVAEPQLVPRSPRAEPQQAPRAGNARALTAPLRLLSQIIHNTRTFFRTAPPVDPGPTRPHITPEALNQPPSATPRPETRFTPNLTSPAFYLSSQLRTASPLQPPRPPTEVSNLNTALHLATFDRRVVEAGVADLQQQLQEARDDLAAYKALNPRSLAPQSGSAEASPSNSPAGTPPPAAPPGPAPAAAVVPAVAPALAPAVAPAVVPRAGPPLQPPAPPLLARQPPAITAQVNHRTLQSVLMTLDKLTELHRGTHLLDWVERAEALLSVAFTTWDLNAENETLKHIPCKMSPTLFKSWALLPHDSRPATFSALRAWLQLNNELLVVDHKGLQMSQLVAGKVAQGGDSVALYSQKFLQAWTITGSTDTALQLCLFQKGLINALQTQCVTDPAGRPWTDLPSLIQFAGGREHTYFAKLDLQGDSKTPHRRPRYPSNSTPGLHALDCSELPPPPVPSPGLHALHTPQKRAGPYQGEGSNARARKSWLDNNMPIWAAAIAAGQGNQQAANCHKGPRTAAEAVALGTHGFCVHCCIRPPNAAEHFRQKACHCVPVPPDLKAHIGLN